MKKKIFIPVSVKDELPEQNSKTVHVIYGSTSANGVLHSKYFKEKRVTIG